ncbi:MAG: histidine phosphatase family protein [Sphingomonadaceae bacterium]
MRLTLVRHPQPDIAPGICYGRSDVPVAAPQLALTVATLHPILAPDATLYSSPLQRCRALALALGHAAPVFDMRLAEMNFGSWELQPWDAIPRADIDAWAADLADYRPGGAESVLEMAARVAAFYADVQRQQRNAIIICHAGTMRLLAACHRGLPLREAALLAASQPHAIPYGGTLILDL